VARRLAAELARAGVTIVSGLARGIDAEAHEGALEGEGLTIAVLGSGVDVIYPAAHSGLASRIVAAGGTILSQFAPGTPPARANFPRRNVVMAALSDVVVVVEAAQGSGSLITANAALELGREVMAVPGSIFSAQSVGCHQLIRDGAALVQNARDVLTALGRQMEVLDDPLSPADRASPASPRGRDALTAHLSDTLPLAAEDLARKLSLPFAEVLSRLTALELDGCVKRHGDGYLRLTATR
jgi:DNA processing protein